MGGSSKSVTVGYKYYVGMHMVLCRGPVDFVKEVKVDDKLLLIGSFESGSYIVAKDNLFGGESREGGVSGVLDIMGGELTQTPNSYLTSKLGSFVPAFRGVLSVVLRQMYLGINPYLKKWSFNAQRIHVRQNGLPQWYDEKAQIVTLPEQVFIDDLKFPATSASVGPYAGVTINSGFTANDVIIVSKPENLTYKAWSYWLSDSNPLAEGLPWTNAFWVTSDSGTTLYWGGEVDEAGKVTERYATLEEANAAHANDFVYLTGSTSYTFWIMDTPVNDNRGGLSLRVWKGGNIDMNPAHIIRECLTDPDWGMGYSEAEMDDVSFMAAADTLYSEGMGMSLLWDTQISIEEFVQLVCKHINASIYVDRKTGLFVLKLIRQDYDEEALLVLNPSNVSQVQDFSRVQFGELVNSITVSYWNASVRNTSTLTVTDIALASTQGATINTSVKYDGFTNSNIASRVAQRDLKALSTPLISCTIYANTDASNLNIGDCFKLTWPDYDINEVIMRVVTIGYGDGKSNRVRLTCTQDVFAMPDVAYIAPTPPEGVPTDAAPVPVAARVAFELPYLEAVQQMGQSAVDSNLATNPDIAYFAIAAGRPSSNSLNARLYTDAGGGYQDQSTVDFCPFASVVADFDRNATSFDIENLQDASEIQLGSWFQIGSELMSISSISGATINVKRGLLDTVPVEHAAGEILFFWDLYAGEDSTQYVSGETISGKLATVTGSGVLPLSSAPADSVTMVGRMFKPYAPGKFQINGNYFPLTLAPADSVLTWAHRDRRQQTGADYVGFLENSIGPEAGTSYTVRVYGETNSLVHTESGISGTTWTYTQTAEQNDSLIPDNPTAIIDDFSSNTIGNYTSYGDTLANWSISGGFLNASTGTQAVLIRNGVTLTDFTISAIFTQGSDAGLVGRFLNNANYYVAVVHDASASALANTVQIYKRVGGTYTQVGSTASISFPRGTPHTLEFSIIGNVLTLKFDGVVKISATDSSITSAGGVGPRHNANPTQIDQFQIGTVSGSSYRINGRLRIELESVRDGSTSFQKHNWTFERTGYGFNYGKRYGQ